MVSARSKKLPDPAAMAAARQRARKVNFFTSDRDWRFANKLEED
jgi:hypothetical protein